MKLITTLILFSAMPLFIAMPLAAAEFTADTRIIGSGRSAENRLFYADDRWRIEEHLPKNEYRVTIFRADHKKLFVLWPDKKRYLVQPLPEKEFQIIATRKPGTEVERTVLGQEEISSYPVTKHLVIYDVQGRTVKSIEWFSKKLGVVIKSEAEDQSWSTEMTNITEGRLDPKLFEVPADFELLSAKDVLTGPPLQREKKKP